ncbi:flagellin, partial [Pseudoalteromonas sp. S4389]
TANMTKMQILQQASKSSVSQANQRPPVALSRLGKLSR